MKYSGYEWIGNIPCQWDIVRVKDKFILKTGFTPDTKKQYYYTDGSDEAGFEWATIADLSDYGFVNQTKSRITEEYVNEHHPQKIAKGSLLYSFKLSVGKTAFTDREIFSNEAIASFESNPDICLAYFNYASTFIMHNANENIYGAKILNQDLIKNAKIPYPSLGEQKRIADYLDSKCSEINELIQSVKEEVGVLNKYKSSVITAAVTKGINAGVEVKPTSKVEWIEQMPVHWKERPFRFLMDERNEKNNPIKSDERLSLSIGLGVTTYEEKTTNLDRFKEDVSQYKLAHVGDLVLNSMNMIVGATGVSDYYGCVSPAYYTYFDHEEDHIISKYCEYLFLTPLMMGEFHKLGKGIMFIDRGEGRVNTCRLKVSRYDLGHVYLPVPPIEEIRDIVHHLDDFSVKIDSIIKEKTECIEKLNIYKKTIIYEYVTGKKEVSINE